MLFHYEIKTASYCRAMEFLRDHEVKNITVSCPNHVFRIDAEFREEIEPGTLKDYNSMGDFSIRRLPAG